jgi:tryptophan synthase alpha chain
LKAGVTPADCFALLRAFRERHPDVPCRRAHLSQHRPRPRPGRFYARCAEAGRRQRPRRRCARARAEPFASAARAHGSRARPDRRHQHPPETLQRVAELGGGYTYCVARAGVTGVETEMKLGHDHLFAKLADYGAPPPVVGFGISRPEHVRAALAAGAAGVISGSAIVRLIEGEADPVPAIRRFVEEIKEACHPLTSARN